MVYLATFVPLYGLSVPDILEAQRRIFSDNTTTAIAGHTYMSAWPSWPFLVRPVWYLFDKIGDDRIAAVVFLGNPLVLWPALLGARGLPARLDRDAARRCVPDPGVLFRAVSRLGGAAAHARIPVLLFAVGHGREPGAGVCRCARGNSPRWLLWAFVALAFAGFAAMLPISAAFVGTSMETFNRLMIFQNWI